MKSEHPPTASEGGKRFPPTLFPPAGPREGPTGQTVDGLAKVWTVRPCRAAARLTWRGATRSSRGRYSSTERLCAGPHGGHVTTSGRKQEAERNV
ncbi:hypothetical protein EYF80_013158 [Liparis tanakae]|uniref:Uncharacterized protein n=1 Tax=Liparis tanakae TaxID=230148 RepID=A0A4Z2IFG6_9TELE|nr:hypothetical protein EYF80_013158 [Liparis tanakae]